MRRNRHLKKKSIRAYALGAVIELEKQVLTASNGKINHVIKKLMKWKCKL